jgi:hypothetical protein
MKRISMLLAVLLLTGFRLFSQSVSGTWIYNSQNINLTMLLLPDGSGEYQGNPVNWKVQGSQLSVDDGIRPVTYTFKLNANTLVLSGGGLKTVLTFRHPGEEQENPVQKQPVQQQNYSAGQTQQQTSHINQDNKLTNRQGPRNPVVNNQSGPGQDSRQLDGVWQGPTGKLVFYSDGTMQLNGISYKYTATAGNLNIIGNDGSISFGCSVTGAVLTLSQNGNSAKYNKVSGVQKETVDQQLVGKWCIMSSSYNSYSGGGSSSEECITLNADGTYIYSYSAERSGYSNNQSAYGGTANQNGDRGTWKTDGQTITSISQVTGQTNRYPLSKENNQNGDPVLVIGGKKFVTAYNRPGWR